MASAAYLVLLEQSAVRWTVAALITAREALHGWTSAGSGAYSIAWAPMTHAASLRLDRGLYRQLLGVWEGATPLTVRANLATVQANPGSYFYDEAAETLYVETAGSVNPDTLALIQVAFTVRVATEPLAFSGIPPFDAQIDGQSVPSVRLERPELIRGVIAFPSGDLTLQNADGFWDYPAAAWIWHNATIEFKLGADSLAYADYEAMATMQVARPPAAGDTVATFQLRSRGNATARAFPQNRLGDLYGPTAGQGRYMPMWWGTVRDIPLMKSHQTSGSRNFWSAVDGFLSGSLTVTSVESVDRGTGSRTAMVEGVDYWNIGGSLWHGLEVHTSFDADLVDVVATLSRSGASTCGAVALDILRFCDIPDALIDIASFDQADIDNPAPVGLYAAGGADVSIFVTGADLLNMLERSCLLSVYVAPSGLWTARVWDPSFDWASLLVRTDADLFRVAPVASVQSQPVANVLVRYSPAHYAGTWLDVSKTSLEASYILEASETQAVDTCLVNAADATLLATRLQMVASQSPIQIDIEDGPPLLTYSPGDKVRLQRSRGAGLVGAVDEPMEIERIQKRIGEVAVEATISNMRGLGARVKRPSPGSTLIDWATATDDEKMQYAFATDNNGFVVTGDATTFRHSTLW